jgi:hypothetical protein
MANTFRRGGIRRGEQASREIGSSFVGDRDEAPGIFTLVSEAKGD